MQNFKPNCPTVYRLWEQQINLASIYHVFVRRQRLRIFLVLLYLILATSHTAGVTGTPIVQMRRSRLTEAKASQTPYRWCVGKARIQPRHLGSGAHNLALIFQWAFYHGYFSMSLNYFNNVHSSHPMYIPSFISTCNWTFCLHVIFYHNKQFFDVHPSV